ncbi:MAG: hypothetical protein ACP5KN_09380 [Armatimonadota bacterium]
MRSLAVLAVISLATAATAAEIEPDDVMLQTEIEGWGETRGMTAVEHPQASGWTAMSMDSDAVAVGGLRLEPGEYTLLFWAHAPAGDQDAFFVEVDGERARLKGPIGSWGTIVHPFTVAEVGAVGITVIGQEAGMTLDRMAVVRGSYEPGEIEFAEVPGEARGEAVAAEELPRLTLPCSLQEVPQAPFEADERTLFRESFDEPCPGVSGEHRWEEGRWGQALVLDMPDGRFDIDVSAMDLAEEGTIEWWVKPRPAARVWWDQGWHYFLHAEPAQEGGVQLDLARHPMTALRLGVTLDADPYSPTEGTHEQLRLETGHLSVEDWHHMLVSWDLTGERQRLWLLIDGEGVEHFFPRSFEPTAFARIELCNTPSDWDIPYLPMDGAIDELRITGVSVRERVAE